MKRYILVIDSVGKTKLELSIFLKRYNVEIVHAKDEFAAMSKLFEFHKHIKLVIWNLETGDNDEFLAVSNFKNRELLKDVPLMVISPLKEKKYVIKAIKAGSSDYIVRPFSEHLIIKKIDQVMGLSALIKGPGVIEEIFSEEEKVIFSLQDVVSIHLKGVSRGRYPLSIILLTLVETKEKGQEKRMEIVSLVNKVIKTKLRETDILIKYGAESILILLPYTEREGATIVENKVWETLGTNTMLNQRGDGLVLASSMVSIPEDGKDKESLMLLLHSRLQPTMFFTKK